MKAKLFAVALVAIAAACGKSLTKPNQTEISFSVQSVRVGPDTATLFVSANQPVMWSMDFGKTMSYGELMPEVGPATEYKLVLTSLSAVSRYYYQVWARSGSMNVSVTGEFQTLDYPVCDSRNTTAPKVTVTVTYRPMNHAPNPMVYLEEPELLNCDSSLASNLNEMVISRDSGVTYTKSWQVRVNEPNGSAELSFRALRSLYGNTFDGWADSTLSVNGVTLVNHSASALPAPIGCHLSPSDPTANNCPPGFRWYFSVDSAGYVTP